jgi:hypothetical protein
MTAPCLGYWGLTGSSDPAGSASALWPAAVRAAHGIQIFSIFSVLMN